MNHVEPWVVRGCRRWSPTQALPLVGGADWGGASSHVLACVRGVYVRRACVRMHSVPLPRLSTLQGPCSLHL